MMQPHPGDPLDDVGPHLHGLSQSVDAIQKIDPQRLYGDAVLIDSAILALMIVRREIAKVRPQAAE